MPALRHGVNPLGSCAFLFIEDALTGHCVCHRRLLFLEEAAMQQEMPRSERMCLLCLYSQ